MRTTLNLDQDIYEAARALAESEKQSIGRVVSRLARGGLGPASRGARRARSGFPVISLPKGSPPVTPGLVKRALEED